MQENNPKREKWGSKIGFIFAAAGSAIGLGNIWKFPYIAGEFGGGAFVFVYLISLGIIGFTLMLAEFSIGRHSQLSAVGAFRKINSKWSFAGALGVLTAFFIMGFYPIIGGWSISYIFKSISGEVISSNPDITANTFINLISGVYTPIFWTIIFMILNIGIVFLGIGKGIEKASKILMPSLFILLIVLAIRTLTLPGAEKGLEFYLKPDFSKINGQVILAAMAHSFFSLSLGMGCMVTYGSYLDKKENLLSNAVIIPLLDTFVAFMAGLVILPAVFAFGFEPNSGPGLVFITLPAVFSTMPAGQIFAVLFFVLLTVAALTSSISLLEVVVSYFIDQKGWKRSKAVLFNSIIMFILCIAASLSNGVWANIKLFGLGFLDIFDYIASYVLLPIGGIFVSIFIGWVWGQKDALQEVTNNGTIKFRLGKVWVALLKFVLPLLILAVFIYGSVNIPLTIFSLVIIAIFVFIAR